MNRIDRPAVGTKVKLEEIHQPWWRGAVLYQIYPRSFADSTGDGIGDLPGIVEHLDHVASLGVDGIWISPFFRSPMRDFGYDVSDFCDVDPIFGDMADFDRVLERAHELGLKVIIDQVYSHTSDLHEWFQQSRLSREGKKADWYVWADAKPDGSPPSNWQSVFGGPSWTWDARREQYYLHNFLPEQPDLNLHNKQVQDAVLDCLRFWLDKGVDGVRLDAVNFSMHDPDLTDNPPVETPGPRTRPFDFQHHVHNMSHRNIPEFLKRMRSLANEYGDRFLMAEVGGESALNEMQLYTSTDQLLQSAYGFSYLYAPDLTAKLVAETQAQWDPDKVHGWPSWTFSNHDAPRAISRWANESDREAMASLSMLLLVCLRGNVIVYQGEELGLPQAEVPYDRLQDPEAIANWPQTLGRDGARTPMPWMHNAHHAGFSTHEPWLPVDPRHLDLSVDIQEDNPDSTLQLSRRILRLRKRYPALATGEIAVLTHAGDRLELERKSAEETLMCVFNLGSDTLDWQLPQGWEVIESVNGFDAQISAMPPFAALVARKA